MSSSTSRKPNEQIKYLYKLNSNYKGKEDHMGVNGINLNRNAWSVFEKSQNDTLKHYIKTYGKMDGIVDEYIHDPKLEIAMKENADAIKFVHRKKIYSRDILVTYTRKQLEEIAREYLIDPRGKVNNFLIQHIMNAQTDHRKTLNDTSNFFEETNVVEVIV